MASQNLISMAVAGAIGRNAGIRGRELSNLVAISGMVGSLPMALMLAQSMTRRGSKQALVVRPAPPAKRGGDAAS